MTTTVPLPLSVLDSPRLVTKRDLRGITPPSDSAEVVRHLQGQVAELYGGVAGFNVTQYNAVGYSVDAGTASVPVTFRDEQNKRYLPTEFDPRTSAGYLASCPIPPEAQPAVGSDAHLGIAHVLNGVPALTEYWRARRDAQGAWSAVWGGRIDDLTTTTGQYRGYTGVSASGLMMPAYTIGIREAQAGKINHAVGIGISRIAAGAYSFPAVRTDGRSTMADAIHMGRMFRLRADVDLDAIRWDPWPGARWRISAICRMIAEAAKIYGLIVIDTSGGVAVGVESGAPTKVATGVDPWPKLMNNWAHYRIMGGFPWEALEVMPFDVGKVA